MSFVFSKLLWAVIAPGNLLFILCIIGAWMSLSASSTHSRAGSRLCLIIGIIGMCFVLLPVGDWLLLPLEGEKAPPPLPARVDGIILLGGAEDVFLSAKREKPSIRFAAERYTEFVTLANRYTSARLVFTGGSGTIVSEVTTKEKDVARSVLGSLGIQMGRITFEGDARNTYENAVNSRKLVHPTASQNWLLVTSAYHMTRSLAVFRKAGWNVYPAPAEYLSSGDLFTATDFKIYDQLYKATDAIHEYAGLLAYRLMGYTDTLWVNWHQ